MGWGFTQWTKSAKRDKLFVDMVPKEKKLPSRRGNNEQFSMFFSK